MKKLLIASTMALSQAVALVSFAQDASQPGPGQSLLNPNLNKLPEADVRQPDAPVDATLTLNGGSAAAGIGYVWGRGLMTYQGTAHKFKISGPSAFDVGGSHISSTGEVMYLSKLADFAGRYASFGAGATVASGRSAVYSKNQHGVVVKLTSDTTGLRFNLSTGGITVKMLD